MMMQTAAPPFDLTIFSNLLAGLRNTIFDLLRQNGDVFQSLGTKMFLSFATILIVWSGIKFMYSRQLDINIFLTLVLLIVFGFTMLSCYSTPIVGLSDLSFSELIPKAAFGLADTISLQTQIDLNTKLQAMLAGFRFGSAFKFTFPTEFVLFFVITALIAVLELAMFVVIAFGYVALAVILLVGPIMIPFFLVPKLDYLFWGWLKSLISYSFYPLIANALLWMITKLMLALLTAQVFTGPSLLGTGSTGETTFLVTQEHFPVLIVIFVAGSYAVFKIPTLVSHIFTGSSGASIGDGVQTAVSTAVKAAVL